VFALGLETRFVRDFYHLECPAEALWSKSLTASRKEKRVLETSDENPISSYGIFPLDNNPNNKNQSIEKVEIFFSADLRQDI
jgi:hypothetical protein